MYNIDIQYIALVYRLNVFNNVPEIRLLHAGFWWIFRGMGAKRDGDGGR